MSTNLSETTTTAPQAKRDAVVASPSELARRINEAHDQVKSSLNRSAACAINAGLLLLEAKSAVTHGSWAEWIGANCAFSERTAQLYMQLARKFPNPQSFADLTITDLMEILGPLKLPEEKTEKPRKPKSLPKDRISEAIKSDPLSILQRAWDAAGENERNMFRRRIIARDSAAPPS